MKKSILLSVTAAIATALMWAGLPQKANGQSMPGVPSVDFYPPSAASLITSVEYPVSHMTGVPDISIPLYTVRSGDLELPIVLRFHSGEFFRSNTYSGPLGAGWSLSCDMEVTHSIRGLSDIVGASTPQQRIVPSEDNYGNLTLTDTQKRQLAKGVADGEPDLFYYSTLSGDGRFYLGNDGSSVTMLECNGDKVQFSSGGQAAFTVTDSHGRVHSYAGNSGPMDTSGGMVFSWKLKGIRTYNAKDSISFSYYRDTLPMPLMSDRIELYDSLSLSGAFTHEQLRIPRLDLGNGMVRHLIRTNYSPTGYQLQWDNSPAPPEFYYSNPRNNHYVSRISFRGGHVEFQYQTIHPYYYYTAYVTLLSRMDVYADGNSTPIKTIIFEYPSSITIRDHCTATLSSITINGTEKYSFDYPADVRRMGGTDFWSSGPGGYPGIPSVLYSQVELPPGMMWNMTTATWSNESRVYTDNQGGWHVLRQSSDRTFTITYPTGGKTVFTFENDRYHDTESTIAMTTTRRVSRIRHYDRDNTLLKTIRYEYGENGDGVGHIWHMPTLTAADMSGMMARTSSMTEQLIKYYNRIGGGAGSGYYSFVAYARRRTYIHGTVFDDCFRGDRFISYPVVTEYQDNDGTVAGKRVYRYDLNLGAVNDMSEKTFPYTIQQEYWQCGRPESEASYRHTANGWQLVDSTAYVYGEFYGQSNIKVARAWQKTVAIEVNGNMTADEVYDRSEYTFRTAKMQVGCNRLLQTVLTERADDGRLLVTTQQKGYLNNIHPHIPKTNTITYPDGNVDVMTTLYAEDLNYSPLVSMNRTGIPMQTTLASNGTVTEGSKWLTDSQLNPAYFYRLEGGAYSLVSQVSWNNHGRVYTISNRGMPLRYYVWDSIGQYPVSETLVGSSLSLTTSATYSPLVGLSSLTAPSGLMTKYDYDSRGNLMKISIHSGNYYRTLEEYSTSFDNVSTASERPWTRSKRWRTYSSAIENISWCNGLGRTIQETAIGASPSGKDIVLPVVYDSLLRADAKTMLPYEAVTSSGDYRPYALAEQESYYTSKYGAPDGARAWYEKEYDRSPSGAVLKERLPGSSPSVSQTRFISNGSSEVRRITFDEDNWDTRGEGALSSLSWYPASSLYCLEETNPDGDIVKTYTDGRGRTILIRQTDRNGNPYTMHDTYYVYDRMGRLRLVLPPKASETLSSNAASFSFESDYCKKNCYVYWYDDRGNVTGKRIPQCDTVNYEYDNGDRIVKVTDGNMRAGNSYMTISYDALGREQDRTLVKTSGSDVISQKAYDSYPSSLPTSLAYSSSHMTGLPSSPSSATGLPTYEKLRVFYNPYLMTVAPYIERVVYYDRWGNIVQTAESTHKGGVLRTSRSYDYQGNVLHEVTTHTPSSGTTDKLDIVYSYDNAGRLTGALSTVNETHSSYTSYIYDETGDLIGTDSGTGTVFSQRLVKDIKGRRVGINASVLNTSIYSDSLSYTPAGNVYSWRWQQGEQQGWQHTAYYDAFGRMSDLWTSELSVPGSTDFSSFGYDSNNNLILTGGETFTTDGNQRTRYSYDANGNVTYDNESDIEITYNVLNLPNNIFLTGPAMDVPFVYTADGRKVEMSPGASFIYYYGPFRYENGVLKYIFIPGGYVEKAGNTYASRFVVSDHLGSTRAIIGAGGTIIQQNDYSPWGEKIHSNDLISGNFPYLYGGKESLEFFDIPYYDSIARLQTTDGVFLNADPLAEASYGIGPWAYCAGNPLSLVDPFGLTTYMVDGVPHDIDDGYNDTIEVSADEFWAMTAYYGAKNFGAYNLLRIMYMNTYGYTTGEGQLVLAVSKKEEDSVMITQGPLLFAREDEPNWNPGTGVGVNSGIYSYLSKERFNNKYWRDANYVKQPLSKKGSNRIGKKQWAKARSIRLKRIGKGLGLIGVGVNSAKIINDLYNDADPLTIVVDGVDLAMDGIGFIPYIGPVVSISYPLLRDKMIDYVILPAYEYLTEQ